MTMSPDTVSSAPQGAGGKGKKNKKKKGGGKQKASGQDDGRQPHSTTETSDIQTDSANNAPNSSGELPNGTQRSQLDNTPGTHDDREKAPYANEVSELDTVRSKVSPSDTQTAANSEPPANTETDHRFEALVRDRDSLRTEVAELRRSLEQIQSKHDEEMNGVQEELKTTQTEKEHAESQYHSLLGKVNTIKSQLGERLKADAEELSHTRSHVENLENQKATLQSEVDSKSAQLTSLQEESAQQSKELSSLRNRMNLSQQNWLKEKGDLTEQENYLRNEFEEAKQAMHNWEILAMEERSVRENLEEKSSDLEEQLASLKAEYEKVTSECSNQSVTVDGLQRALQELQTARKNELRELVESSDAQIEELKRKVRDAEQSAADANASFEKTEKELQRALPFEKEVKEKNLLIGKLRHEAVTLNEHLTKALRFLKRGRPEDNVDRHIVTNHLLHFLTLDRSDPKKFQILQLIGALLGWTDEQREQAGLTRPGASTTLRPPGSPPVHRTPSSAALSTDYIADTGSTGKETLAELWSNFLEQEAQAGAGQKDSRSESLPEGSPQAPQ